jgi:ADP-heptose:LPS heptosyltransferase
MHYYTEFGGGLGDVFNQIYTRGTYPTLEHLAPNDRVDIVLICHNPSAEELFKWHPNRHQFNIHAPGYCHPRDYAEFRQRHNLPTKNPNLPITVADATDIHFFVSETEEAYLQYLPPYVVLAPGAGERTRNIPDDILYQIQMQILANTDLFIMHVGRNYARGSHVEPKVLEHGRVINVVDKLSVPATARLVHNSMGLITCHSALNLLAWHIRKPQLLLYPPHVAAHHRMGDKPDQWMFGINFAETTHCLFDQFSAPHVERFMSMLHG